MFVLANILQPLIDVFEVLLKAIHSVIGSWGFAIVGLTILIRLVLLPLTLKQVKSMQRMQRLAPEMKAIQQKYKDDKQRQSQEMMKFYRENNVNPMASCLPLVAQLPVFISLFYMLQSDLRHDICGQTKYPCGAPQVTPADFASVGAKPGDESFLFIPDLTNKATGAVLITLIVLYVGSQLASSLMMSVTADKTQRRIFMFLPFVFVPFIIGFPAGLLVYWITTNTWTIGQQFIVRRTVGPLRPAGDGGGGLSELFRGASGGSGASSGGGLLGGLLGGGARAATNETTAGSGGGSGGDGAPKARPPPPPRRKRKQRSGRRR